MLSRASVSRASPSAKRPGCSPATSKTADSSIGCSSILTFGHGRRLSSSPAGACRFARRRARTGLAPDARAASIRGVASTGRRSSKTRSGSAGAAFAKRSPEGVRSTSRVPVQPRRLDSGRPPRRTTGRPDARDGESLFLQLRRRGGRGCDQVCVAWQPRRSRIVFCEHAFHGLTYGALSLNGEELFRDGSDRSSRLPAIPFNGPEAWSRPSPRDAAAFIVEPIQGKGVYPADRLATLPKRSGLCRRYRNADDRRRDPDRNRPHRAIPRLRALELEPDMVLLAKALSGGFVPVGAVLMRRDL